MIIPNIWENKKCSKPPTSKVLVRSFYYWQQIFSCISAYLPSPGPPIHQITVAPWLLWRRKLGMSPRRCERRAWLRFWCRMRGHAKKGFSREIRRWKSLGLIIFWKSLWKFQGIFLDILSYLSFFGQIVSFWACVSIFWKLEMYPNW